MKSIVGGVWGSHTASTTPNGDSLGIPIGSQRTGFKPTGYTTAWCCTITSFSWQQTTGFEWQNDSSSL